MFFAVTDQHFDLWYYAKNLEDFEAIQKSNEQPEKKAYVLFYQLDLALNCAQPPFSTLL